MGLRDLTLTQTIHIDVPPERVWDVFRRIRDWPRWNRVCLRVGSLEGEPWSIGFRFFIVLRMAGVPIPFHPTVVAADLPHRIAWSSTQFTITGRHTFLFQPFADGTRVIDEKHFASPIFPVRLFYPRPVIAAMSKGWLRSLKEEVEGRAKG
ncbi:MAG: SRPBCC family protein [Chloroflexi bacterium]|nr:SRPBCC family protein [Chloroflexota bacterium]